MGVLLWASLGITFLSQNICIVVKREGAVLQKFEEADLRKLRNFRRNRLIISLHNNVNLSPREIGNLKREDILLEEGFIVMNNKTIALSPYELNALKFLTKYRSDDPSNHLFLSERGQALSQRSIYSIIHNNKMLQVC